jgi:hypothetical protein
VRGPGIAKARGLPLVEERIVSRARGSDARWRELFDRADVVSEGSVKHEVTGDVWYGSTSLVLVLPLASCAPDTRAYLAAFAARDLHVRLRALRAARAEATLRAPQALGPSSCEIRVSEDARGVRIDVDIQAPLIGGGAGRKPVLVGR